MGSTIVFLLFFPRLFFFWAFRFLSCLSIQERYKFDEGMLQS